MNAFSFRDQIIRNYETFSRSFVQILAKDIKAVVDFEYAKNRYWPEPLIQINPTYKPASTTQELAESSVLHPTTAKTFRVRDRSTGSLIPLRLHKHQQDAFALGRDGRSYVVTTGTGSGKSLAFFIPIVDRILKVRDQDPTPRTRAIVIYPMNALANSQAEEIGKFLENLDPADKGPTFARYTGQESEAERDHLAKYPPDILLTSPVRATHWVCWENPTQGILLSGITALSRMTMIADDRVPVHALGHREHRAALENGKYQICADRDEATARLEVWNYNPKLLTLRPDTVDPLSLYLTLKDDPNERIQDQLETLMERFTW